MRKKLPNWFCKTYQYAIRKKLYMVIPLTVLSIMKYVGDIRNIQLEDENKVLSASVTTLVTNQIGHAGIIEQTELSFWVKELVDDRFRIVYISPGYQRFIPRELNRYQLLGRTGHYLDHEFGEVYQRNDKVASKLAKPKVFVEPYRDYGVDPVRQGKFLKGKINETGDRVLVFGMFVEEKK